MTHQPEVDRPILVVVRGWCSRTVFVTTCGVGTRQGQNSAEDSDGQSENREIALLLEGRVVPLQFAELRDRYRPRDCQHDHPLLDVQTKEFYDRRLDACVALSKLRRRANKSNPVATSRRTAMDTPRNNDAKMLGI
jgi:hypothetical protein